MSLVSIVKKLMQPVAFSVALASSPVYVSGCGEDTKPGCSDDYDCKGDDRVCVDNECVYGDGKTDSGSEEGPCGNSPLVGKYLWNVDCERGINLPINDECIGYLASDNLAEFKLNGNKMTFTGKVKSPDGSKIIDGVERLDGLIFELTRSINCDNVSPEEKNYCQYMECYINNDNEIFYIKVLADPVNPRISNYHPENLWKIRDTPWSDERTCEDVKYDTVSPDECSYYQ